MSGILLDSLREPMTLFHLDDIRLGAKSQVGVKLAQQAVSLEGLQPVHTGMQ